MGRRHGTGTTRPANPGFQDRDRMHRRVKETVEKSRQYGFIYARHDSEDQEEQSLELERIGGIEHSCDRRLGKSTKVGVIYSPNIEHSTLRWRLKRLLHGRSRPALVCAIVEDFGKPPRAHSSMNVRFTSYKLSYMQVTKACGKFS